ncbi:calcineurin-like phosphoesterase superfamily domain protein [bacterium BMS3Abin13]|nr:calcineurin-like phosphoesterase superfamily domain protein [bacterium BMS3Abin13]
MNMKITVFSDTHTLHNQVNIPEGDILIFAGDMDNCRREQDVAAFNSFLEAQPHRHKVVIGGNHDHQLAGNAVTAKSLLPAAVYLQDELIVIAGITIYGAPWQPLFNDRACDAFALPRGKALKEKWSMIPEGIDILVTHTPPAGVMDLDGPVSHGCFDLTTAVNITKPKYHVFGHIHNNHGMIKNGGTTYINCNVKGRNGEIRPALSFEYDPVTNREQHFDSFRTIIPVLQNR